jgi:hypothetical protein
MTGSKSNRTADEPTKGQQSMARVDAWMEQLATETDAVRASEQMRAYLRSLAKFHRYSLRNQILIEMQMPNATRVASYRAWLKLGRQVRKGEHGASILVPYIKTDKETGERVVGGFGGGTVFDVSQTDGEPLPSVGFEAGAKGDSGHLFALYDALVAACAAHDIMVRREHMRDGLYGYSRGGLIALNDRETKGVVVPTLIHEMAHEVLHQASNGGEHVGKQAEECQAEAVAYAICSAIGVEYTGSSTYLALYGVGKAALLANLEAIKRGASTILGWLDAGTAVQDEEVAA